MRLAVSLGFLLWYAAWGGAIDVVWRGASVPEHATLGHFYRLWLPLSWFLFAVATVGLPPPDSARLPSRVIREFGASPLLGIFLLMEAAWRVTPHWESYFGAFFVVSTLGRGAAFLWPLFGKAVNSIPVRLVTRRVFVGSLLIFGLLAPWVVQILPVAGDEPHYLLIAHSLQVDHDLDLRNNYENEDYRTFHQVQLRPQGPGSVSAHGAGFPLLLLPGYALGGRLGATWVVVLLGALLSVNVYRFCWELSESPRASAQAWALTMFTVPVATYAHQLFPETAAALGMLYAYRTFRAVPLPPTRVLLRGVGATFASIFLKVRYAPVALVLWAALLARQARDWRWIWRWLSLLVLLGAGFQMLDWLVFDGFLIRRRFGTAIDWLALLAPNPFHAIGPLGLLFDQKAGLFMYSPVYLIGFLGLTFLIGDRRRDGALISLAWLVYLYLLIAHTREAWHGEFSPSPRYLVVVLPLLSGPLAIALLRCRGRLFRITWTGLSAYSLTVMAMLMVFPRWRFRTKTGQSMMLSVLDGAFSTNLADRVPSLVAPTPHGLVGSAMALALCAGLVWYFHATAE